MFAGAVDYIHQKRIVHRDTYLKSGRGSGSSVASASI